MSGRPSPELEPAELPGLVELHARLARTYRGERVAGLDVLAAGEISVVLRWEEGGRAFAVRPLPPFPSTVASDAYHRLFRRYLDQLTGIELPVVRSGLLTVWGPEEGTHASRVYCAQPLLPAEAIGPAYLRRASDADTRRFLDRIATWIAVTVSARRGLDGQASNWAVLDGEPHYLDVTTPMLRDEHGREELDTELFLEALPALLRPAMRRLVVPRLLETYYDPRSVRVDFAGNLLREDLGRHLTPWLERVNPELVRKITEPEVRRYIRADRLQWSTLQVLRRLDRAWRRHLRREPYPFLLP